MTVGAPGGGGVAMWCSPNPPIETNPMAVWPVRPISGQNSPKARTSDYGCGFDFCPMWYYVTLYSTGNLPDDFGKSGTANMGGFGSGPQGGRLKVEACRSIDVNRLHRDRCLRPGWQGGWEWKQDGQRVAWISMRGEANRLVLNYRVRRNGDEWTDVEEPISVGREYRRSYAPAVQKTGD